MNPPDFPCEMISAPVRIGSESFTLWTAKNPDRLLEALAEKAPDHPDVLDERLPYWAELWPSARILAEAILTETSRPEGRWLELGCGPGLPGLAAFRRGHPGIWSDYMPEALTLAAWNARCAGIVSPATRLIDWRNPPDDLRVPWILAADVAYEERNFLPLLESFGRLLTPGGEVWLGEPGRPVAETFFEMLSTEGWHREKLLTVGEVSVWRLKR
jgi:predicted nicotinamide N-methyase